MSVTLKQNVQGYMDGGVFHPIRASEDYDDVRAGEHKPFTSRRTMVSKAAKKRLGIKTVPVQPRLFNPKKKANPVRVLLHKFYAGQKLSTRSIGDHDVIYRAEVISRTPKMVTFKEEGYREIKRAKIHRMDNTEYFYPHGKHSMASIFTAEKGQRANPKKNPDAVSTFAQLAAGISSALSIHEKLSRPTKRKTMKKRGTTTAKTNPRPKTARSRNRNLYALTIGSGDDIFAVVLKDKDGDGFSKEFKSMASAKAYATRNKHKVEWNPAPVKIVRKRNVDGFVDDNGVFHPIRSSEDYSPAMAGERGITKRKAAKTVRSRFKKAATKKKTLTKHRATPAKAKRKNPKRLSSMTRPELFTHYKSLLKAYHAKAKPTAADKKKVRLCGYALNLPGMRIASDLQKDWSKNPAKKKSNGIISRAVGRYKAGRELKKELRAEAKLERIRARKAKAIKKATANPTVRHNQHRPTYESFQGRPSTLMREMEVSRHAPKRLDQLGDLIELKIAGGPTLKFNGGPKLCAARGKLWIAGKRFAKANPGTAANVINPIGEIDHVVYGTRKPHHGDNAYTHYIHKLGEESGKRPILCVDREGFPVIRGGNYTIESRGIVD